MVYATTVSRARNRLPHEVGVERFGVERFCLLGLLLVWPVLISTLIKTGMQGHDDLQLLVVVPLAKLEAVGLWCCFG